MNCAEDAWVSAMRRGEFERAWAVSDAVLRRRRASAAQCFHWPRHLQYVWDGAPFEGKHLLVRCYHGLGDTIQFARFFEGLRARAARVTVWAQAPLLGLLESTAGIDALLPLHDGVPEADYDLDMESMEAAHALRIRARDLPGRIPYLHVSGPAAVDSGTAAARLSGERRVGLVWRAGEWNPERSIAPELLAPLGRVPNVRWHSLQYPCGALPFPAVDLACRDVVEMARRMQGLDLIVSVDTMAAHLAGALGLPVWTLLPFAADWRWCEDPTRTRWYPSMRLLRQSAAGAWSEVIERLRTALVDGRPAT